MLIKKSGASRDEDFGKIMGVTKSAVGLWKNEKSPIPIEKFLTAFGQETLDWIKQEYGLESQNPDNESEEMLKAEARKIQLLFDRGLINVDRSAGKETPEGAKPVSTVNVIEVPHYTHRIAAGMPTDSSSPAEKIALPSLLVKHPRETYAVTVAGDSMLGANIEEGDILIVDTAIEPVNKSIVIASINGEQTVKRLLISGKTISLAPENHKYQTTEITGDMDFRTLGVVTWVIRKTV